MYIELLFAECSQVPVPVCVPSLTGDHSTSTRALTPWRIAETGKEHSVVVSCIAS